MTKTLNKIKTALIAGLVGAASLAPAFATSSSTDPYSSLVSAVNFSTVTTDVVSVGALVVAVLVAIRAVRFIYTIVRR
jgi:hypothetical protein